MKPVRIVCVGIGGYAKIYLEALIRDRSGDFQIVGLVDVCPQNCRFLEELSGIPLYESMEAFYAENTADLCIITTPIHLHTTQILTALSHGSHVMCEKPLSGCSADEDVLMNASKKYEKFVMIGYQWSYSHAVNRLKADVLAGVYGKPQFLKTMVLWPRSSNYFNRTSRWAGRIAIDGVPVNDSVANNAAAHYLHNILYVTGKAVGSSSEVCDLQADLLRLNNIENFDTAVVRFRMDNGATGLFVGSHATDNAWEPSFEYRFERGTVYYDDKAKNIVGRLENGEIREYGDPSENVNEKIYEAIRACRIPNYQPVCGVVAATPHVRCIEKIQSCAIHDIPKSQIRSRDNHLFAEGLYDNLLQCYLQEKLLCELPDGERWVSIV